MNAAFLAIIVAIISIQVGAVVAKLLFPVASPFGITALRLVFASLILMAVFRPWRERLTLSQFKLASLYGLTLGFMNLSFYLAIERISLGLVCTLQFAGPLGLAIVGSKKRVDFLWALLAAVGIILISPLSNHSSVDANGVVFALFAALFWALYIILGQKIVRTMHGGRAISIGMAIGSVAIMPIAFFADGLKGITLDIFPLIFVVALFSSAIPYSLEIIALKHVRKMSFGILMSLEPALASFVGLVLLNEQLTTMQLLAIILIIIASLGTTMRRET